MKQVLVRKGQTLVAEVPAPVAAAGEVLVHLHYSCVSAGTELAGIKSGKVPLYRRALSQPDKIRKVLEMLRTQGMAKTAAKVKRTVDAASPLGYSAAGTVLQAGEGVEGIGPGDRVSCAGSGVANHAEFVCVPKNLVVKVPDGLGLDCASTVTLGSIALQGVRRANPKLGETVAVVGLGILGQLAVQLLKANGCRVIGVDPDRRRVETALAAGMDRGPDPETNNPVDDVIRFSGGRGADAVIITASTPASDVVNHAMRMCRKKGRVVVVGAVGLDIDRGAFYEKELDLLISTAYGPGRYDERYERDGIDYPYAYVRWTENRNMQEYLRLLEEKKIDLTPLIERVYRIEEAPRAYEELRQGTEKPLIVLLRYSEEAKPETRVVVSIKKVEKDRIGVAVVGAGAFAREFLLPNLKAMEELYALHSVVCRTGASAKQTAERWGMAVAATDYRSVLKDPGVDMVLIATRHNLHAHIAIEAAEAGKAVFCEKPMAMNHEELKKLVETLEKTKTPYTVGFNRRFSPYASAIKDIVSERTNPFIADYRVNAGFIPGEHWVHTAEGGGRNIGEACHIYDLFTFLTGSEAESVCVTSLAPRTEQYSNHDNFCATIKFSDGSVCTLTYTSLGSSEVPKERMDLYTDGAVVMLDNYTGLEIAGRQAKGMSTKIQRKGYPEELAAFAESIRKGDGYPIPLSQLVQASEISFAVEAQL